MPHVVELGDGRLCLKSGPHIPVSRKSLDIAEAIFAYFSETNRDVTTSAFSGSSLELQAAVHSNIS